MPNYSLNEWKGRLALAKYGKKLLETVPDKATAIQYIEDQIKEAEYEIENFGKPHDVVVKLKPVILNAVPKGGKNG